VKKPRMTRRRTDHILLVAVFFLILGRLSVCAQTVDIELTPTQATVYVGQCTYFFVSFSPAQASTVDISIEYSDPSRLSYVETGFPIYAPGTSQFFSVCGRIAGTEPITITVALPPALGGETASATAAVINPVPQPLGVWPSSIRAGSASFDLQILQGWPLTFLSESQVLWNGVQKPATLEPYQGVCPGICPPPHLRIRVSAEDLSIPGSAQVVVRNPAPGGGDSAPLTLTILPGVADQSVPLLSPRLIALLALLLAASGIYVLRNQGGA
jgi:hypothetical protein